MDEIGDFSGPCFHVIRDDLLHPMMGGNKLRKLDAIIPLLQAHEVTDVVSRPAPELYLQFLCATSELLLFLQLELPFESYSDQVYEKHQSYFLVIFFELPYCPCKICLPLD